MEDEESVEEQNLKKKYLDSYRQKNSKEKRIIEKKDEKWKKTK